MTGVSESHREPYVVEIRAAISEDDHRDVDSWVHLLDRLSGVERARNLMLAMPSITEDWTPEGGREVVLRWVGIHDEDAPGALQQVVDPS